MSSRPATKAASSGQGRETPATSFPIEVICLCLVALTIYAYAPITKSEFIRYDDPLYVTANEMVQQGISWEGIKWAFTSGHASNWHPLTWLSHMLDCQVFGGNAFGHHLMNLLFHLGNTVLLFLFLRRLTGATWRSAFVAALFALHPMHVESVAWISERKDVLSTFLGLVSTWFYVSYVHIRNSIRSDQGSGQFPSGNPLSKYLLALFFFACSLMSKPMLVTLPFVWLLLDWWPLRRVAPELQGGSILKWFLKLGMEKVPFLILTIASSIVTYRVQQDAMMAPSADPVSLLFKLAIAGSGYLQYILKLAWPVNLAVFYPVPKNQDLAVTLAITVFLLAFTVVAFLWARKRPWFTIGWLWYLGTLVPVIGFVKVGMQSIADRYTYIPSVGLFIIVAWGAYGLLERFAWRRWVLVPVSAAVLIATALLTQQQVGYWKNNETLFEHALAVTKDNAVAHDMIGLTRVDQGRWDEARQHFAKAVLLAPTFALPYNHLGSVLLKQGDHTKAVAYFTKAVSLEPDRSSHHEGLGEALLSLGKVEESLQASSRAIELEPQNATALYNAGTALLFTGSTNDAVAAFQAALKIRPGFPQAHNNLAFTLNSLGQVKEAELHYMEAVKGGTNFLGAVDAHYGYANLLMKQKRLGEAEGFYVKTLQLDPKNAGAYYQLGVITEQTGRLLEAAECWRHALQIRPDWPEALNNLAWLLATARSNEVRNGTEAMHWAERLTRLRVDAATLDTLAAVHAENGSFPEAVAVAEKALALANQSSRLDLSAAIAGRLALYREEKPFRQL